MKFLVDHQLPPAPARWISSNLGADAYHVVDVGLRDGTDVAIWEYATQNDCILISKDDDFVTMYSVQPSARLLWVRVGNCRRAVLLRIFRDHWQKIAARFECGERFVELR